MQLVQTVNDLLLILNEIDKSGGRVALVPTMGALHTGHLALVEEARKHADWVVVSIFVNPKQFGPLEDFEAYPRPADEDMEKLQGAAVDLLWMPSVSEMYPEGFATSISVAGLSDRLCGAARPGHFDGVSTVVTKLFTQIRPQIAIFGEKDWQQLAIIRRLNADLNLGVKIIGLPTLRAEDGLALSSRNAYLSAAERAIASIFPKILRDTVAQIEGGQAPDKALEQAKAAILKSGFDSVDYVEYVNADTLEPLETLTRPGRLIAATRLGKTRLIDNFRVHA